MADMMSTLRTLLGDNADDKIKNAMNMLQSSGLLSQIQQGSAGARPAASVQAEPAPQVSTQATESSSGSAANSANALPQGIPSVLTPEGMQFLNQIRGMVDQVTNSNDSRSNLLRSLRPFMRTDRQRSIDRAIRIMNIGRFSGLFGR